MRMKKESKPAERKATVAIRQAASYSGPIPDPMSLEKYESIQPGFADRIISMAENEAKHRHEMETQAMMHTVRISNLGIIFAFISVLVFGGLIFYALCRGLNVSALGVAIAAIASVAGVFVFMRSRKARKG